MDLGLRDKVAFVSGGSRGLGRAIAEALASEGARVVVSARNQETLDEVVQGIATSGGVALAVAADLQTRDGVRHAVQAGRDAFGSIDIAFHNVYAADIQVDPDNLPFAFDSCSDEQFEEAYDSVAMSLVYLAREVLPDMKAKRWGRLISMGTSVVKTINTAPLMILSHTGRLATVGLMKSLSWELAPFNITVNGIATGAFKTDLSRAWIESSIGPDISEEQFAETVTAIPMRRFGLPEEFASLALFLASERSGFITGETIRIDGGSSKSYF